MTIQNIAQRDQVLAALRDARADLEAKRAEVLAWSGILASTLIGVDLDPCRPGDNRVATVPYDLRCFRRAGDPVKHRDPVRCRVCGLPVDTHNWKQLATCMTAYIRHGVTK